MILQGAGNDLGGRGGIAVHQHDDRIVAAVVAVARGVHMFGGGAAFVRNDHIAFGQEMIAHRDGFIQQAARIAAQVENEAFELVLIHRLERFFHLVAGGFVELFEEHVADARLQQEGVRHALAADFVADDVEHHGLIARLRARQ